MRWSIQQILETPKNGALLVDAICEIVSGHVRFLSSNDTR